MVLVEKSLKNPGKNHYHPIVPFGLKQAITGRKALGARLGAIFGLNCRRLVRLGWTHGYHRLWPGILIFGPILGHIRAKTGTFGAPGRQEEARYHESNLGTVAGGIWDQIWLPGALRVPPRPPKGVSWAKTSHFGAHGGQEKVQ